VIFEFLSVAKNVVAIERGRLWNGVREMKSLNAKIALTALGVAIIATPALAQRLHRPTAGYAATQSVPVEHCPNGAQKTGTAANRDSGAEFNLGY
jgi:hypothetical protein